MKKLLTGLLFIFSFVISNAQTPDWTPNQVIPLWQKRQVPSAANVDSSFSSIMFKSEKDSFAYANPASCSYNSEFGAGTMDSTLIMPAPVEDVNNQTLIGTSFIATNVIGYPAYTSGDNVIIVNSAVNLYYNPSDTLTVTLTFQAYTPSGGTGIDTVQILLYANTTALGGISTSTKKRINNPADTWKTYTVTMEIPAPVNRSVQTLYIVLLPKLGARLDTATFANVRAKISN